MDQQTEISAGVLGGAAILAVLVVFAATHYQAIVHPAALRAAAAQGSDPGSGITFPTVEQMCNAAGVSAVEMPACISDENSAAEFVGAWLGLNGFLVNGRIDLEQIQLSAQLDSADAALDPPAGDPLASPDLPSDGLATDAGDPFADAGPADNPTSPAQIALDCLGSSADDWLKMHDCIARNDPASRLDGN